MKIIRNLISYNKVIWYVSRIKHQIISQTKHNVIFYKLNVHIIKYIKKYWIYFCLKSKIDCKIKKYNIFFLLYIHLFYYVCRELIIISTWITFIIEFLIFLIAEAPFWKNMRNIGPIWLPRRRIEFPYSYSFIKQSCFQESMHRDSRMDERKLQLVDGNSREYRKMRTYTYFVLSYILIYFFIRRFL